MTKTQLNSLVAVAASVAIFVSLLKLTLAFTLLKPFTTILIIMVPVLFGGANSGKIVALTIVALIACLAGDVFLLNEDYFVYGLSAFLVAHLLFTVIFYQLSLRQLYWAPLIVLFLLGSGFYSLLLPELGDLTIPVAIYISCILLMCWQGIGVWLSRRDEIGKYLGFAAVLFVFSDSIIALNKFLIPFELSGVFILSSYWLSIAIIANVVATSKLESPTSDFPK